MSPPAARCRRSGRVDGVEHDPARALSCHWRAAECSPDGDREGPALGLPVFSGGPLLAADAQGRPASSHRTRRPRDALRHRGVAPSGSSSRQASPSADHARYPKPRYLAASRTVTVRVGAKRTHSRARWSRSTGRDTLGVTPSHRAVTSSRLLLRIRQRGVVVHEVQRPRDRRMSEAWSSARASHVRHGSGRSSAHGRAVSAASRTRSPRM
jgi:hypothetical protein